MNCAVVSLFFLFNVMVVVRRGFIYEFVYVAAAAALTVFSIMLLSLRYIRSQLIWVCVCAVHARYFFVTWWLLVSVRFKFAFYNINWWMLQSGHKLYVVVATYENNIIRILCKCHNSFNVHQHNVQQFSSHGCCTHAWRFHRNTPTLLCTQHINKKPIKGRERRWKHTLCVQRE